MTRKIYNVVKYFCHHQKKKLKNLFEVALQHLFNIFILLNTVFNLKLRLKLKINTKTLTFENLEEISQKNLAFS